MKTDDLIDRLAREADVAPLPAAGVRTTVWALWALLYVVIVAVMMRRMMAAEGVNITPLFLAQQGAALLTGISAARAAFVSVIPGAATHRAWTLAMLSAGAWLAAVLAEMAADARAAGAIRTTTQADWPCVASMMLGGLVLGGPLVLMLRRGAPLTPRPTAFLIGLAALSIANIEACLTRPHAFAATVLLWHGTTIAVAAVVCFLLGRHWFRWPSRPA